MCVLAGSGSLQSIDLVLPSTLFSIYIPPKHHTNKDTSFYIFYIIYHPNTIPLPLQLRIKSTLNPLFHIYKAIVVEKLPRTASNKIMRRVLRDEYMQAQQALEK